MKTECNYPSLETINLPYFVPRAKLQQLLHSTIECTSAIYTVRPYILFFIFISLDLCSYSFYNYLIRPMDCDRSHSNQWIYHQKKNKSTSVTISFSREIVLSIFHYIFPLFFYYAVRYENYGLNFWYEMVREYFLDTAHDN